MCLCVSVRVLSCSLLLVISRARARVCVCVCARAQPNHGTVLEVQEGDDSQVVVTSREGIKTAGAAIVALAVKGAMQCSAVPCSAALGDEGWCGYIDMLLGRL